MKWISVNETLPEAQDFVWDGLWTQSSMCVALKVDGSVVIARYCKADGVFSAQWQEFGAWFRGAEHLRTLGRAKRHGDKDTQDITHWHYIATIYMEKNN